MDQLGYIKETWGLGDPQAQEIINYVNNKIIGKES